MNYFLYGWEYHNESVGVKYIDGNIKKEKDGTFERSETGMPVSPNQPGYPEWWKKVIVESTGDRLKMIGAPTH